MRAFKIMPRNVRAFRTATGVPLIQFDFLTRGIEKTHPEIERAGPGRPGRRRVGAGRPFSLHLRGNGTDGLDVPASA
ncbi:MAG: hypothetical protein J4G04_05755 [Nitrosopumilaceae archaeon]|nr:hypothetical protein [Nitrosopumilaceae archaeon]